jgi:hypothetical protein
LPKRVTNEDPRVSSSQGLADETVGASLGISNYRIGGLLHNTNGNEPIMRGEPSVRLAETCSSPVAVSPARDVEQTRRERVAAGTGPAALFWAGAPSSRVVGV